MSASAKRELFLQPSLWETNSFDIIGPAKTNFSAVLLSGTCEVNSNSSGKFEIVMSGHDLYFKRIWQVAPSGWYWNVEMAVTNFFCNIMERTRASGPGGGGSIGYEAKQKLFLGRRLWGETNFIGASNDLLKITNSEGFSMETEEFSELKQFGQYSIPQRIIFVDWEKYRWTYQIDKVEFRNAPNADWFVEIRNNHFHYSPQEEQNFISEQSGSKTNNRTDGAN